MDYNSIFVAQKVVSEIEYILNNGGYNIQSYQDVDNKIAELKALLDSIENSGD